MLKKTLILVLATALFFSFCCLRLAQSSEIEKGVEWLITMQLSNGAWAGQDYGTSPEFGTTVRAVLALVDAGYDISNSSVYRGSQYIMSEQGANGSWYNDLGMTSTGVLIGAILGQDISKSINWILAQQQPDGSFSSGDLRQKRALTAYAIISLTLTCSLPPSDSVIQRGKQFLLDNQNPDGSFTERPPWNAATETAFIMMSLALAEAPITDPQMVHALEYVSNNQHPDGGWGPITPSHSGDTGLTILSLITSGIDRRDSRIVTAVEYLISSQNADGSWPDPWASNRAQCQTTHAILGLAVAYGQTTPYGEVSRLFCQPRQDICNAFLTPDKLNVMRDPEHSFKVHIYPCEPMDVSVGDSAEVFVDLDDNGSFDDYENYLAIVGSTDLDGQASDVAVKVYNVLLVAEIDPYVAIYSVNNIPISDTLGNLIEYLQLTTFSPRRFTTGSAVLEQFSLEQNYPNPFNPETGIQYYLPHDSEVKLTVYNLLGQKVKVLVNGYQTEGLRRVRWEGKDEHGNEVASGIYFYRIKAGEFSQIKKMVLLR